MTGFDPTQLCMPAEQGWFEDFCLGECFATKPNNDRGERLRGWQRPAPPPEKRLQNPDCAVDLPLSCHEAPPCCSAAEA